MRRLMLVMTVLALVGFTAVSFGLDIQSGSQGIRVAPGSNQVSVALVANSYLLPDAYTIYSGDASEDFYVRRVFNGVAETYWMKVPAGKSILLPAPEPSQNGSQFQHLIQFAGHADTLYVFPWSE